MKKYPLGHAIISWKEGGYSEAVIFQDREGLQYFACANWTSGPCPVKRYEDQIAFIISDYDDIYNFLLEKENDGI